MILRDVLNPIASPIRDRWTLTARTAADDLAEQGFDMGAGSSEDQDPSPASSLRDDLATFDPEEGYHDDPPVSEEAVDLDWDLPTHDYKKRYGDTKKDRDAKQAEAARVSQENQQLKAQLEALRTQQAPAGIPTYQPPMAGPSPLDQLNQRAKAEKDRLTQETASRVKQIQLKYADRTDPVSREQATQEITQAWAENSDRLAQLYSSVESHRQTLRRQEEQRMQSEFERQAEAALQRAGLDPQAYKGRFTEKTHYMTAMNEHWGAGMTPTQTYDHVATLLKAEVEAHGGPQTMTNGQPAPAQPGLRQSARGSIGAGSRQVPLTADSEKKKVPEIKDIKWNDQLRRDKAQRMQFVSNRYGA